MSRYIPSILIVLLFAGSLCAQDVQLPIKADTTALEKLFKAQRDKNDELLDRIKELEHFKHTPSRLNVLDYGVILGDPNYDNGPPLSKLLATCDKPVFLPAGDCYFQTPIVMPVRRGIVLEGSGISCGGSKLEKNNCVSRLIYLGDPSTPAVKACGQGWRIDNIVLQRGDYPTPRTNPPADGSVGLLVAGNMGHPTAKAVVDRMAVIGWDCAIEAGVGADSGSNHGDTVEFRSVICQNNNTLWRNKNPQAKAHSFGEIDVHWHTGIIFDCVDCADIRVRRVILNAPALVCRIGSVSSNNGKVVIDSLDVDNNARGFRILEQAKPCTFSFTLRDGLAGNNAVLSDDLIKLYEPNTRYARQVSITLERYGSVWKWEAK